MSFSFLCRLLRFGRALETGKTGLAVNPRPQPPGAMCQSERRTTAAKPDIRTQVFPGMTQPMSFRSLVLPGNCII
jgi:hypothetical protein